MMITEALPAVFEGARATRTEGETVVVADYGDPVGEERALLEGVALARRSVGDIISVEGPDAWSFLQSLLSADLDALHDGDGIPALFLQPQGKLLATMLVLRISATDAWLVTERGTGPALLAALERFKIRVDVELRDRSGDLEIISALGPQARRIVAVRDAAEVPVAPGSHRAVGRAYFVSSPWPGIDGVDCIARPEIADLVWRGLADDGAVPIGYDVLEAARIRAGVPRLGVDINDRTIPQEASLEVDAVSFTKGCFIGQELVCRIDTRGHVNQRLRLLRISDSVAVGAEVDHDGKSVGTVSSVAHSPRDGWLALATVRREVDLGSKVFVGSVVGTVEPAGPRL
jgi:folate-binding protein YgfZ